ncbi:MAG: A/G-specific adenine glycosylase [bacterium]|nr:A/G-specific adenine glycosylase [bacterium]
MSVNRTKKSVKLLPRRIRQFQQIIWDYYEKNGRHDLPWRLTDDTYTIFISEIMLQQTQVPRVLIKYPEFLGEFPDINTLARASLANILNVWQGMGYNRRAIFLKKAAREIIEKYDGNIPNNVIDLESLPGIGIHTAGAIMAFAFNAPVVFIETNIRRTFIHHFFQEDADVSDTEILPLVRATLPVDRPRDWYNALMDYGSYVAKNVANPNHKSRHYKKQSSFDTSVRKVRGVIINTLTRSKDGIIFNKELDALPFERERINMALAGLMAEDFLKKKRNGYGIS